MDPVITAYVRDPNSFTLEFYLQHGGYEALRKALATTPPSPAAADAQASSSAADLTNQLLGGAKFNTGRFLVALGIFLLLLAGGITTDAMKLTNSYTTLFALSTTIFGVIVGFLGGEKS